MKIAVIDCGTNTFNLLISEVENGHFTTIYSDKVSVKIGKGGIHNSLITMEAAERAFQGLKIHKASIEKYGAEKVSVVATSAFRSASNAESLIDRVFQELDLKIDVIEGKKEAKFIYEGVKKSGALSKECALIMDVGGGSCEFIIADETKAYNFFSFDTGVSRLVEMFSPTDPIQRSQISEMYQFVAHSIKPLLEESSKYKIANLIGSSGTFDTFADMIFFESGHTLKNDLTLEYSVQDFEKIYDKIIYSNLSERLNMPGMAPFRAEMIVASVIHVKVIIDLFTFNKIISSAYSLKEGVLMGFYE